MASYRRIHDTMVKYHSTYHVLHSTYHVLHSTYHVLHSTYHVLFATPGNCLQDLTCKHVVNRLWRSTKKLIQRNHINEKQSISCIYLRTEYMRDRNLASASYHLLE